MNQRSVNSLKKSISIRARINIYLFVFVFIIIALLWLFQSVFLDDIYMLIKTNELYEKTGTMISDFDDESFIEKSREVAIENKICVFVYNNSTQNEICSHEALEGKCDLHKIVFQRQIMGFEINEKNLEELTRSAALNGGSVLLNVSSDDVSGIELQTSSKLERNDSEQSVILAKIIKDKNGDEVLFLFNCVISPLVTTVKTLNTILVFISILLLLLAVAFSVIIAFVISKPISDITTSAKELAKGNYAVRFCANGFSEVAELSNTLNYASEELSKVDGLKNELISNVSHDLRTPITLISGYAQMMRDIPGELSDENLQIIIDESGRMENLVNDILDVSKLQSGNIKFNPEHFNLTKEIEGEISRYNALRSREGFCTKFIYQNEVNIIADRTRIIQVLYNLLNNAANHSDTNKSIEVIQSIQNGRVRISVKDYGCGISPQDLPLIWDRYYKVDKARKRVSKGSGLGLSIVKKIIEAHKGGCGVESTEGLGSTFWFELDIV